jgi:hypothetical protein
VFLEYNVNTVNEDCCCLFEDCRIPDFLYKAAIAELAADFLTDLGLIGIFIEALPLLLSVRRNLVSVPESNRSVVRPVVVLVDPTVVEVFDYSFGSSDNIHYRCEVS